METEDKKILTGYFKAQARIKKLDDLRVQALSRQDAFSYYNLCNNLGVEPEDKFLYDSGQADYMFEHKNYEN